MSIEITPMRRSQLELKNRKIFAVGANGPVFGTKFAKKFIRSMGVELLVENHTSQSQEILVEGRLYPASEYADEPIIKWHRDKLVFPRNDCRIELPIPSEKLRRMKVGKYKVVLSVNKNRIDPLHFTLTDY